MCTVVRMPRRHRREPPCQLALFLRSPAGAKDPLEIRLTEQDLERLSAAAGAAGKSMYRLLKDLVDAEFERARQRIRNLDALEGRT